MAYGGRLWAGDDTFCGKRFAGIVRMARCVLAWVAWQGLEGLGWEATCSSEG